MKRLKHAFALSNAMDDIDFHGSVTGFPMVRINLFVGGRVEHDFVPGEVVDVNAMSSQGVAGNIGKADVTGCQSHASVEGYGDFGPSIF